MKLKIVPPNQENRVEQRPITNNKMAESEQMQEAKNSPVLDPSPTTDDPILVSVCFLGKRKRKQKEIIYEVSPIIRKKKKKPSARKFKDGILDSGGTTTRSISTVQSKSPIMIHAEEFRTSLTDDQPNFLKSLVRSHVGGCCWMGLPGPFCRLYLPSEDIEFIVENENGEEFEVKYIAHKTGLSAGWKRFATGNKLLEGDVLVFQLTGPCRFKVYVIRANDLPEVDPPLISLLNLDSKTKKSEEEGIVDKIIKKKTKKQLEVPEHSGNYSDEVASEVSEGPKFPEPSVPVKTFEEFHIVINGKCIDSEIPENICREYFELCLIKNTLLHNHLIPGLCSKLSAGVIFEAVRIAGAIRASKLTTPRNEFEVWDKSLESFEILGLNVGFLRERLVRLIRLAFDSDMRRYWDTKTEENQTKDETENLEAKLVGLREISDKDGDAIANLKMKGVSYEIMFEQEANAPW